MVNVVVKEPDELTITVRIFSPSNRISIEELGLKLEPVTVTVEPGVPLVGDNVMLGRAYTPLDKPVEIRPTRRIENKVKKTYLLFNGHNRPCAVSLYRYIIELVKPVNPKVHLNHLRAFWR